MREAPSGSLRPPPGLAFDKGAIVFGAFGPDVHGVYEIYAANTTGWEPLVGSNIPNVSTVTMMSLGCMHVTI